MPPQTDSNQGRPQPWTSPEWQPFPFVPAHELTIKPIAIDWLVENIIERGSLNLLFGEPGAGKSLFALDWAFCMAAGIQWLGYRTQETDVVIVAGEGFSGMARRLKALESKYQMKSPARLFINQRPAQFLDEKNVQWVADTIKAICPNPGLVIVDTLHRNMDGDENSSQDIGRFIANLDDFIKPLGAAVLVVHHSGHGQKDRSRGSSSIRAAMDGEFSASKNDNGITLACHKAKDFEAFKPMLFTLKPIDIGWLNDDGENLTSVYLEHSGEIKPNTKKRNLTAIDNAVLASLGESITEHGVEPTAEIKANFNDFNLVAGKMQKIVNIHLWQEKAYKAMDDKTEDARRMAFSRCRAKLRAQGLIIEYDNYAWRVFEC